VAAFAKALALSPMTLHRRILVRSFFKDIRDMYDNCLVNGEPVGNWWLKHPQRRTFSGGIVFKPNGVVAPGEYNLWQGFAYEPKRGDWSLLRKHIHDIVCRREITDFNYYLNWMAHAVKHPERPAETAIVMRGEQGAGKGFPIRAFGRLFGQHYMHVITAEHVVGKHNAHLLDCIVLFADEVLYASNPRHADILKGMITEPVLTIEPKNVNAYQAPNRLHVMLSSNHDWVLSMGHDDRRYFVLEPSSDRLADTAYFAAIQKQLDEGGYEAMLYDLQHIDLSEAVQRMPGLERIFDVARVSLAMGSSRGRTPASA